MSNIASVIGWKHNHQEGMTCKMVNGVLTITEFPGGVPTKAKQATWTAEYDAYLQSEGLDAAKQAKIEQLKNAELDRLVASDIARVNAASDIAGVEAV